MDEIDTRSDAIIMTLRVSSGCRSCMASFCSQLSAMDDQALEWFWRYGDHAMEVAEATVGIKPYIKVAYSTEDLSHVAARIGELLDGTDLIDDYTERTALIKINMGSLRLCQLERGELIREVGGIDSLLATLFEVSRWIQCGERSDIQTAASHLAIACWKALRELACGSIGNRIAIRLYEQEHISGLGLMINFLRLFEEVTWEDMDALQIDLVTAVIGTMRNASHRTYENCKDLHDNGATTLLAVRVSQGRSSVGFSLPEQSQPWREGCFRAAGTLLNIAEEYEPCLKCCSTNPSVIAILLESWGSNKRLAVVFSSLLKSSREGLTHDEY